MLMHLRTAFGASNFFNLRNRFGTELGCQIEESFRLLYFAANLNHTLEAVSVRPAGEGAMFQDRKFGTRPLITLVGRTVVVSERYLNEHLHGAKLISERCQSMSPI